MLPRETETLLGISKRLPSRTGKLGAKSLESCFATWQKRQGDALGRHELTDARTKQRGFPAKSCIGPPTDALTRGTA